MLEGVVSCNNGQNENRLSSSNMVINLIDQSESRPLASTSSAELWFTHLAEPETWFKLFILTLCLKNRSRKAKYLTIKFPLY